MTADAPSPRRGPARFFSRPELRLFGRRSRQVLLLSALTGLLTGLVVAGFEYAVEEQALARVESLPVVVQALVPGIGLAGAALALRTLARSRSPEMTDEYIRNFHDRHHRLDRRPVLGRLVASALTLGSGGTLGFEGPSIYAGAAVGAALQARLSRYFTREEAKTLMVAGAAAGLAAIFKAPATGAAFAIEVPYQDDIAGGLVLPALCGAAVSYATFAVLRSTSPLLPISGSVPFALVDLAGAALVGLASGAGAQLFAWGLRATKRAARLGRPVLRLGAAAALLAVLAVASHAVAGQALTIGPGYRAVGWALDPRQALTAVGLLLVLRAVAVLATLQGGGAGGLFIPLVVEGALLGRLLGGALGQPAGSLYPLLGIAAFLAAGYRTPLTGVIFVAETTGRPGFVVPGLIAAVVAQLVMGRNSVAPDQRPARAGHLEGRLHLPLTAVLATDTPTTTPTTTVRDFITNVAVAHHAFVVPVIDHGTFVGVVDVTRTESVPAAERRRRLVAEVMDCRYPTGRPAWTVREAIATMEDHDVELLPIVDPDHRYRGVVSTAAILALNEILSDSDDYAPSVLPTTRPEPWYHKAGDALRALAGRLGPG